MRVIVPYATDTRTGQLGPYPETRAALEAQGIEAEYVYTGKSPEDYHELLSGLWREGTGWINIEQDIVPWPGAIAELEACPEELCAFPYELSTGWGAWLGCTKFSTELIAREPGLFHGMAALPFDGTPKRYWGRLDTRMYEVLERAGRIRHLHWPAVEHLHESQKFNGSFSCPHGKAIPREVLMRQPWPYPCPPECTAA